MNEVYNSRTFSHRETKALAVVMVVIDPHPFIEVHQTGKDGTMSIVKSEHCFSIEDARSLYGEIQSELLSSGWEVVSTEYHPSKQVHDLEIEHCSLILGYECLREQYDDTVQQHRSEVALAGDSWPGAIDDINEKWESVKKVVDAINEFRAKNPDLYPEKFLV